MAEKQSYIDATLSRFASMLIKRMDEMAKTGREWEKPWFTSSYGDLPRNLRGTAYSASNAMLLQLLTMEKKWEMPVFMTFNQALEMGACVKKGETSWPVFFWQMSIKDADGNKVEPKEFKNYSADEKALCTVRPIFRTYNVFNIDQTTFSEVNPELYQKWAKRYAPETVKDVKGMYANEAFDRMIEKNEWLCPIELKESDKACYRPGADIIILPMKGQFRTSEQPEKVYLGGQNFYSTLAHEMAHSTGHKSRLNRVEKMAFGDPKYAKEELVAELSSAFIGQSLGFRAEIADNNASYLNAWIDALGKEPKFILSVLADVDKASGMIMEQVDKQRIALGQDPYLTDAADMGKSRTETLAEKASVREDIYGKLVVAVPGYKERRLSNGEIQLWEKFTSMEERKSLIHQFTGETLSSGERLGYYDKQSNRQSRSYSR